MKKELFGKALVKFVSGLLLVGICIFLPAGTFSYPMGWLFMGILFLPMFAAGVILFIKNPALLEKRLSAREKERTQGVVVLLGGLMFVVGFVLAGVSYRLDVLLLPAWVSATAAVVFLIGYGLYAEVLRENTYLSRTVEVQEGQKVIDTGLYGVVRHPMYTSTVVMFLAMPLVLGSVLSFVVFLMYPILIGVRIRHEEKVLEEGLVGYREYKQKVKDRLIPFVW